MMIEGRQGKCQAVGAAWKRRHAESKARRSAACHWLLTAVCNRGRSLISGKSIFLEQTTEVWKHATPTANPRIDRSFVKPHSPHVQQEGDDCAQRGCRRELHACFACPALIYSALYVSSPNRCDEISWCSVCVKDLRARNGGSTECTINLLWVCEKLSLTVCVTPTPEFFGCRALPTAAVERRAQSTDRGEEHSSSSVNSRVALFHAPVGFSLPVKTAPAEVAASSTC